MWVMGSIQLRWMTLRVMDDATPRIVKGGCSFVSFFRLQTEHYNTRFITYTLYPQRNVDTQAVRHRLPWPGQARGGRPTVPWAPSTWSPWP